MRAVNVVTDLSSEQLRRKRRTQSNARLRIRLLAIANILDGMSRQVDQVERIRSLCSFPWIACAETLLESV